MENETEGTEKQPETKLGRPKKRDRALTNIAEAMGIQLAADMLSVEDMEGFPDIMKESKRNQAIMAMVACGFLQSDIADVFGVKQPTVCEIINRIDPNRMFRLDPKAKNAIITKIAEGKAMNAMLSITREDLMALDADKRANVAQKMLKVAQDRNITKHKDLSGNRMSMLMEQMAAEATDAEFTTDG